MNSISPEELNEPITEEPKPEPNEPKLEPEPQLPNGLPIGLKELLKTDKIVIQQMTGLAAQCLCCYEGENLFEISDRLGHVILRATEDSNCCYRQCCERLRPFEMTIKDRQSNLVIKINRPFKCDNCFCCPCLNQVSTHS